LTDPVRENSLMKFDTNEFLWMRIEYHLQPSGMITEINVWLSVRPTE